MRPRESMAALLMLALLPACGGDDSSLGPAEEEERGPVTLARLATEIFTPKCATSGCHAGAAPAAALSLEADRLAEMIDAASNQEEGAKLIDPGNPDGSYIIRKVKGTGGGKQMPIGMDPLTPEEIQMIVDWVAAGAPTS
ncbi:MAG: hypothetical protein OXG13_15090 [Gemmatimonadaceae bacterium]|nr:hypothetical protein [Gemmatimonadaceae bacterium]